MTSTAAAPRKTTTRKAPPPKAAAPSAPPADGDDTAAANDANANPIVAAILRYLDERRLHPGDRLPSERDLAERLGVGRNALREAIATLTTLRVLESRPNSGIYLRRIASESSFEALVMLADMGGRPTPTEVAESMEVRATLEVLSVRLACARRLDADLERMQVVLNHTERILAEGGNIAEDDTAFHVALVESTHNSVLVRVLNAFYRFTARRRVVIFADLAHGRASARDHRKLYELIKARDAAGAEELILRHMNRARAYWKKVLGPA